METHKHAIGTHGRDVELNTVDDWQSLVGTTWIDDKRNERKIVRTSELEVSKLTNRILGDVHWRRPHWDESRKPSKTETKLFRMWLRKATRVS